MKFLVDAAKQCDAAHCSESDGHRCTRVRVEQCQERNFFTGRRELLCNLESEGCAKTVPAEEIRSDRPFSADERDHPCRQIFYHERSRNDGNGD